MSRILSVLALLAVVILFFRFLPDLWIIIIGPVYTLIKFKGYRNAQYQRIAESQLPARVCGYFWDIEDELRMAGFQKAAYLLLENETTRANSTSHTYIMLLINRADSVTLQK